MSEAPEGLNLEGELAPNPPLVEKPKTEIPPTKRHGGEKLGILRAGRKLARQARNIHDRVLHIKAHEAHAGSRLVETTSKFDVNPETKLSPYDEELNIAGRGNTLEELQKRADQSTFTSEKPNGDFTPDKYEPNIDEEEMTARMGPPRRPNRAPRGPRGTGRGQQQERQPVSFADRIIVEMQRARNETAALNEANIMEQLTQDATFNALSPRQQIERIQQETETVRRQSLAQPVSQTEISSVVQEVLNDERGRQEQLARSRDPYFEPIRITSQYGERLVYWPKDNEDKRILMRDVLGKLEASEESEGGLGLSTRVNEAAMVIESLRSSRDPAREQLGEEMYKEFMARYIFHQKYLAFKNSPDMQTQVQARASFRAEHWKVLKDIQANGMRIVGEIFNEEYEAKAEDFLNRSAGGKAQFRQEITSNNPNYRLVRDINEVRSDGQKRYWWLAEPDQQWAQRLAERLWEFTARSVIRDGLVPDEQNPQKKRFRNANTNGGNFNDRRVMKFKDWAELQEESMRPDLELLDHLDGQVLGATDRFSATVKDIEGYYFKQIYDEEIANGATPDDARSTAKDGAVQKVQETFQVEVNGQMVPIQKVVKEAGKDPVWPSVLDGRVRINWAEFDPTIFGDTPLLNWAFYHNYYPETARNKLLAEGLHTFLRHPNSETLIALKDVFIYMGSGQYDTLARLTSNFMKIIMSNKASEHGLIKVDRMMADSMIGRLTYELGLSSEKIKEIGRERLGDDVFNKLLLGLSNVKLGRGFIEFILYIIKGIASQSLKDIKF